ncbi:MAG: DJ-1/PfpI family protein [Lentisphaerae bacterium]|jgi:4-methyl-5(b-hydroxyethyl)-thiazole monophosphate biosynthesis|nr:DJ-1/PfpI family protein [Lentisphaerota bacterium]
MKRVVVPLAEGVEEIEAVVVVDVLRRAEIEVVTAATGNNTTVTASRGVVLVADTLWESLELDSFDALVLPGGGPGTRRLGEDQRVLEAVREFAQAGKVVAAICAAPMVLGAAGILEGRAATCYPSCESGLTGANYSAQEEVVVDGNLVTSQGPGTSFKFALALIEKLAGEELAASVAADLLLT